MNTEQLKQLKNGDEIFIRATFGKILDDGDVLFTHTQTSLDDEVVKTEEYTLPGNVILPPSAPKYDPCRRFKKGDKVRSVPYKGRKVALCGSIVTVEEDEMVNENLVSLVDAYGGIAVVDAAYLELVTPVEELEPYFTKEDREELWWEVWKRDEEVGGLLVALFSTGEHPNSKAAAEAECIRLNEEYRKEQA